MQTLLLLFAFCVIVALAVPRLLASPRSPAAFGQRVLSYWLGSGESDLARLIHALFNSLLSPARRTWHGRRYAIGPGPWRIVAHPADVIVLQPVLDIVGEDLNGALRGRTQRDRLIVTLPLQISGVVADEDVPIGQPRMVSVEHKQIDPDTVPTQSFPPADDHDPKPAPREPRPPVVQGNGRGPTTKPENHTLTLLWPLSAGSDERPLPLGQERVMLGRDPALGDSQIDVDTVSWHHAALEPTAEGWRLTDLDSTNGTYVGTSRITDKILRQGDLVCLGRKVKFRFLADDVPFVPTVRVDGAEELWQSAADQR